MPLENNLHSDFFDDPVKAYRLLDILTDTISFHKDDLRRVVEGDSEPIVSKEVRIYPETTQLQNISYGGFNFYKENTSFAYLPREMLKTYWFSTDFIRIPTYAYGLGYAERSNSWGSRGPKMLIYCDNNLLLENYGGKNLRRDVLMYERRYADLLQEFMQKFNQYGLARDVDFIQITASPDLQWFQVDYSDWDPDCWIERLIDRSDAMNSLWVMYYRYDRQKINRDAYRDFRSHSRRIVTSMWQTLNVLKGLARSVVASMDLRNPPPISNLKGD